MKDSSGEKLKIGEKVVISDSDKSYWICRKQLIILHRRNKPHMAYHRVLGSIRNLFCQSKISYYISIVSIMVMVSLSEN